MIFDDNNLRERFERYARDTGMSEDDVMREALEQYLDAKSNGHRNGATPLPEGETLYDVFKRVGAIGCIDGPSDLSTNPEHMEGFGEDG